MENPKFNLPINKLIKRFPTNEEFLMYSADKSHEFSEEDYKAITSICNEPLVYSWVFNDLFDGQPYPIEKAKEFIEKAKKEWSENEGFVFFISLLEKLFSSKLSNLFIRNPEKEIVAAIDIKSPDLESAEIGYWASEKYPGLMTNAVLALCDIAKDAGFKSLWATTKMDNQKSMNVLKRAGFTDLGKVERKGKPRRKFEKKLDPETSSG